MLPFLLGDRLVARVDLKSDRREGVLRVRSAYGEQDIDAEIVATELAEALYEVAGWLGLDAVAVEQRGDLAPQLSPRLVGSVVEWPSSGA